MVCGIEGEGLDDGDGRVIPERKVGPVEFQDVNEAVSPDHLLFSLLKCFGMLITETDPSEPFEVLDPAPACAVVPETVPYTPPWAGAPWAHEMRRLFLEVVKHEELVEFESERDSNGRLVPKKDGRTAFLSLRAPNGTVVRVQVDPDRLDEFLGLMNPGYIFSDDGS